jgi:sugar (pentulose or hexulose) kinase
LHPSLEDAGQLKLLAGAWSDMASACGATIRLTGESLPDPAQVETYRKGYPIYREPYPLLKPSFNHEAI